MIKARKTMLSLALAAAVGGTALTAKAVNLADDLLGDVLLFPYYSVNNGWQTLIHLTNTSATRTVAVKVRFQEAWVSRDVLDFILVLSPNDVWTGYLDVDSSTGLPRLYATDNSCTSPSQDPAGFALSPQNAGGSLSRITEGHLTIIEMGSAKIGSAIDVAAKKKDCSTVDSSFLKANIDVTSDQFDEPLNVLKGSFVLLKRDTGLSVGGAPVTLANFFSPSVSYLPPQGIDGPTITPPPVAPATVNGVAVNYGATNLIMAQEYPDFLLPTLEDANPKASAFLDNTAEKTQQGLVQSWQYGVDAVSAVLMRNNVINEWSTNAVNGVQTYWAVSFPTKLHYVDPKVEPTADQLTEMTGYDASNYLKQYTSYVGKTSPAPFSKKWDETAKSCDTVVFNLYDRIEGSVVAGGTSLSPSPRTPSQSLCYEVNVLTFDPDPTHNQMGSAVATAVDTSKLQSGQPYGWLRLTMPAGTLGNTTTLDESNPASTTTTGLPVVGFAMWSRTFGDAKNYGNLIPHSFTRNFTRLSHDYPSRPD